ncbi:unnamed protein product [Colias eurytheme]|nr:unnamed protein product [Colias eurytheme]
MIEFSKRNWPAVAKQLGEKKEKDKRVHVPTDAGIGERSRQIHVPTVPERISTFLQVRADSSVISNTRKELA